MSMARSMSRLAVAAVAPLLSAAASPERCEELLQSSVAELQREQYPTMLTLAEERRLLCPGPDSSFLVGVARANMLDTVLVPDAERPLVREEALAALRDAVGGIRAEWQQTALVWIRYLEELPDPEAPEVHAPERVPPDDLGGGAPRAAPPFEPDVFPWGPVLLGGAGIAALTAGAITGLVGHDYDAELERAGRACTFPCDFTPASKMRLLRRQSQVSTLYTVTNVLLVAGAASVVGAVVWYVLRPTPSDAAVSMVPYVGSEGFGASVAGRF